MSDAAQGAGWWQAHDGKWYPPPSAGTAPPPPPVAGYALPPSAGTNGFAIAALVLGIVWLGGLGSLLALIFGYKATSEIKRSGGRQTGRGMAIAGIVLGWLGVVGLAAIVAIGAFGQSAEDEFRQTGDEIGGLNSDPSDGACDYDRFIEDPDC